MKRLKIPVLFQTIAKRYAGFRTIHPDQEIASKIFAQGLHTPVMLNEAIDALNLQPHSTVLDMTFGAGGHTREILKRYPSCRVLALDRDYEAHKMAKDMRESYSGRLIPMLGKFSNVGRLLRANRFNDNSLQGVLIDAGCSSMQFDDPERGFSLSKDGPLDMRMDGDRDPNQLTAADVVNNLDASEIGQIISKYGQERNSDKIAESIVENRPFTRTKKLAEAVGNAVSFNHMTKRDSLGRRCHAATKTFMALRIFVNNELNELYSGIEAAEKYLCDKGRLAVITFHSLEERVVKQAIRKSNQGNNKMTSSSWKIDRNVPNLPDFEEVALNPRSRSAKLHVAIRTRSNTKMFEEDTSQETDAASS